eukprot:2961869-Prymnesium_polylepis.1
MCREYITKNGQCAIRTFCDFHACDHAHRDAGVGRPAHDAAVRHHHASHTAALGLPGRHTTATY